MIVARQVLKICRFCDEVAEYAVIDDRLYPICPNCGDYKGLISIEEWEEENGEVFEI